MPRHDVVVVGGGVAGAAIARRLAQRGIDVAVLEQRGVDERVNGSWVLTPYAAAELRSIGVSVPDDAVIPLDGVRVLAHGRTVRLPFDQRGDAVSVRRDAALQAFAAAAVAAGATWYWGRAAVSPLLDDGVIVGVTTDEDPVHGEVFVVADGALSRFGRALGTSRRRTRPQALVAVATVSDLIDEPEDDGGDWLDMAIDLRERFDLPVPGLGWVAPVPGGRHDVGVGVLNTFRDSDSVAIADVLDQWRRHAPSVAGHPDVALATDIGRIPLGDGVWPRTGPNWLAIGDAVAMTSPVNGAGVSAALSTASLAAPVVEAAVRTQDGLAIRRYEQVLDEHLGDELRVGRVAGRLLAEPRVNGLVTRTATWSDAALARAVQLAASGDERTSLGRLQRLVASAARLVPEPPEHH